MRDPQQIAHTWLKKAEAENDAFDRFISLWFAFNALYNEFYERDERRAIRDFIWNRFPSDRYKKRIETLLQSESAIFFKNRRIRNLRSSSSEQNDRWWDTRENIERFTNKEYMVNKRLCELLMIVYQVRCNLFHGDKVYSYSSDEDILTNAGNILNTILNWLYE